MANRKDQSNRAPSLPRPEQTERMRGASAQPPARTEAQRQALLERLQPAQEQSPALFQERSTEDRATGRTPSATRQRRIPPALPPRERQTQPATAPPSQPTRAVERQTTSEPIRPSEPASTRQEQTTPPGVSDRVDVPVTFTPPVHQREMSLDALRVEISRQRGFDISHRHTYYTTVPAPPPSREDIENVPESARSSVSRFRRDSRLRQPYTSREERERVRIAQHAMQLATQLSTLHAYLQHLITTQSGEGRYTPIMQDPDVHEPPIMIPTELQQAIDSGLINEFPGRLVIAGLDRVNELFDELPGFENQYRYNYQRLERDLALEDAVEDLLTKLDIVMLLVDIAAPAYLALRATRTLLRRASASLIRRATRETISGIARGIPQVADSGAGRLARELWHDQGGSFIFGGRITRPTIITSQGRRRAWRWARVHRSVGDSPNPSPDRLAELYTQGLVREGQIPALTGVRIMNGRIGRGSSGMDFWCFRRGRAGSRGPIPLEVKHRPSGRDLEFADFRRETLRHQVSPEGVSQDWLRFLRDRPEDAIIMYRDGRIDRHWLDPEWVNEHGAAWFQQPGNRFLTVLSPDGRTGLAPSARQYMRLGQESIIQLAYPPLFP